MPRFALHLLLATAAFGALTACGESREDVMDDAIEIMNETATVLGSVTDVASAEEAEPELRELGERMQAVQKRMEELGDPEGEEGAELEKKYAARMEEATARFVQASMSLMDKPGVATVLEEAMASFE